MLVLTLRKEDVEKRKRHQYDYMANRNALIQKRENRTKQRTEEFDQAKALWIEDRQKLDDQGLNTSGDHKGTDNNLADDLDDNKPKETEFNEDDWVTKWELDKSVIEIPDEIILDEDNDIELALDKLE